MNYNLIDRPFIPCLFADNQREELGLQALFKRAHEVHDIETGNPLMLAALFRLLLAIMRRALGGPNSRREWAALWHAGRFDSQLFADYFDRTHDRFDLFSPIHPFYQTADFTTESAPLPTTKLFHERACANNKTLFDHTLDADAASLTPAEAARGLITLQAYALGGGQGVTSRFGKHPYLAHAPLIAGAVTLVKGDNLFQTLMLNTLYTKEPIPELDPVENRPLWECDEPGQPGSKTPQGYLDYLTWYSRHIRLVAHQNGESIHVSHAYLAQGYSLGVVVRDPFFAYRYPKPELKMTLKIQPERALWRDSAALFDISRKNRPDVDDAPMNITQLSTLARYDVLPKKTHQISVTGLANDKANPLLWRQESLPLAPTLLEDDESFLCLRLALQWVETIAGVLNGQVNELAGQLLTAGGRQADKKARANLALSLGVMAAFWDVMALRFRTMIEQLTAQNRDESLAGWRKGVVEKAIELFERKSTNSLGYSARELRARAHSRRQLAIRTRRMLKKTVTEQPQEATP